jgi:FAD synthetase
MQATLETGMAGAAQVSTAGILIIGNEILTAKVQDENTPYLLQGLRARGIDVPRVHVIPDVIEEIADEVRTFSARFDYVLTAGGVGPTHDDVTMEGVARAFGEKLTCHPQMELLLRGAIKGAEPNQSQIKMCLLPESAELIETPDLWFPLVQVHNVYVFPGIPRLLRLKFDAIADRFAGPPVFLRRVYVSLMETDLAHWLNELLEEFPALGLGSYPQSTPDGYRTLLTLESRDTDYVERALQALVARIPPASLTRVE